MLKIAVIGDPIEHSLSPAVHGAALSAIGVDFEYEKVRVQKGGLEEYIDYAIKGGTDGFNLTMPHKVDILPYLEETDDEARVFKSVNTVCVRNGKLYGHNTDAIGYRLSLKTAGREFRGSRVVILGAGGVVRTLALAAALDGAESICILNRSEQRAREVCDMVKETASAKIGFGQLTDDNIAKECKTADILINATPLGMSGYDGQFGSFDFLAALPKDALVSDLIYNPYETRLLSEAKNRGLNILNGLGMLIFQGLAADEFYLDRSIDMEKIYPIVLKRTREAL